MLLVSYCVGNALRGFFSSNHFFRQCQYAGGYLDATRVLEETKSNVELDVELRTLSRRINRHYFPVLDLFGARKISKDLHVEICILVRTMDSRMQRKGDLVCNVMFRNLPFFRQQMN